jgi:hypothetical protein
MFAIDLDNKEPHCKVSLESGNYAGQTYVSTQEPCLVPTGECGSVYLSFKKKDTEAEDAIKILLDTYNDEVKPEIDEDGRACLDFRAELQKEITEAHWKDLFGFYHTFKVIATEVVEPELMEVEFDEVAAKAGLMESYNDVLPYGLAVSIIFDDITYAVDTAFCIRINCTCSSVRLAFYGEKDGEEILNMENPSIDYDYRTGNYKVEAPGENNLHTPEQLIGELKNKIPEIKTFLKNRHSRLKVIYKAYLKREGLYAKIYKKSLAPLGTLLAAMILAPAEVVRNTRNAAGIN